MSTTAAATSSETQCGQPRTTLITVPSRNRLTPAMSTWATAKLSEFTRCAPVPKRLRMNSGTLRTFEP